MMTILINGVPVTSPAQILELQKQGKIPEAEANQAIIAFARGQDFEYGTVEHVPEQEGDAETAAARGAANQQAVQEMAARKQAAHVYTQADGENALLQAADGPSNFKISVDDSRKIILDYADSDDTSLQAQAKEMAAAIRNSKGTEFDLTTPEGVKASYARNGATVSNAQARRIARVNKHLLSRDEKRQSVVDAHEGEIQNDGILTRKDVQALVRICKNINAKLPTDADIEKLPEDQRATARALKSMVEFDENGNPVKINMNKAQEAALFFTGLDERSQRNERDAYHDATDMSNYSGRKLFKHLGLSNTADWRLIGALTGAAVGGTIGYFASPLSKGVTKGQEAYDSAHDAAEVTQTVITQDKIDTFHHITETMLPDGTSDIVEKTFQNITPGTSVTSVIKTVEAFAEAYAKTPDAVAMLNPWLGAAMGALLGGLGGYELGKLLEDPDIFKGQSAQAVLQNPEIVKGKANSATMRAIENMEYLTDREKAIGLIAAYGMEGDGKKVNKHELQALYARLDKINQERANQKPDVVPPTEDVPPTVDVPPEDDVPPVEVDPITIDIDKEEISEFASVPVIRGGGPAHYAQLYVLPDGTAIKPGTPEWRTLFKILGGSGDDRIQNEVDANGKIVGRKLKNEITMTVNGKEVTVTLSPEATNIVKSGKVNGQIGKYEISPHPKTQAIRTELDKLGDQKFGADPTLTEFKHTIDGVEYTVKNQHIKLRKEYDKLQVGSHWIIVFKGTHEQVPGTKTYPTEPSADEMARVKQELEAEANKEI